MLGLPAGIWDLTVHQLTPTIMGAATLDTALLALPGATWGALGQRAVCLAVPNLLLPTAQATIMMLESVATVRT